MIQKTTKTFRPTYHELAMKLADAEAKLEALRGQHWNAIAASIAAAIPGNDGVPNSTVDGLAVIDMEGNLIAANDIFLQTIELSNDPASALPISHPESNHLPPEEVDKLSIQVNDLIAGKANMVAEQTVATKSGATAIIQVSHDVLRNTQGNATRILVCVKNITENRRMQTVPEASEVTYRPLFDNFQDIIWISNPTQGIRFITPNVQTTLGFSPEEMCTGGFPLCLGHIHPDDVSDVHESFELLASKGLRFDITLRFRCKDGKYVWLNVKALSTNRKGGSAYFCGLISDITERKKTEDQILRRNRELDALNEIATTLGHSTNLQEALKNALRKALHIIDMDLGAVALIDGPDSIVAAKDPRTIPELFGQEIVEMTSDQGFAESTTDSAHSFLIQDITKHPRVLRNDTLQKGGITTFAGVPLKSGERPLGMLCVASQGRPVNISPSNLRLLETVGSQMSIAIENTQLLENVARTKALEEADKLRTELLASVSHELRTPLTAIKGLASTLVQPDVQWDTETQMDFLGVINKEADILAHLVNDLLEMSQLEAGISRIEKEWGKISTIIRQLDNKLKRLTSEHTLVINVPKDLPLIHVDEVRLGQVVTNLVENAACYSEKGTTITLDARESNGEIIVSITDEGVGIPACDLEKVFTRFYRLESGFARRRGGSGLGLSISRRLIESHGGRIWAQSETGMGSSFVFALPSAPTPKRAGS